MVSTSAALAGWKSARNQARALRITAARRRWYSLSGRSALAYVVVAGGSGDGRLFGSYADCFPAATQARHVSSAGPTLSSTKWVLIRRSAKKRSAARVSALFRTPKI